MTGGEGVGLIDLEKAGVALFGIGDLLSCHGLLANRAGDDVAQPHRVDVVEPRSRFRTAYK